jgi:nucleoside diphosphate kinase
LHYRFTFFPLSGGSSFLLLAMGVLDFVKPGVVTGDDVTKVLNYAKENGFAIPAVNCVSSSSINACLEAAKKVKFIEKLILFLNLK